MLRKDKMDSISPTESGSGTLNTIVGQGTYIKGEINVESNIRIDGKFEGRLTAKDTLVVGATGELKAEVSVKNATIGGKVHGNLVASQSVILEPNSELSGDVRTKSLVINEGAVLNGNCRMGEDSESQYQTSAEAVEDRQEELHEQANV